MAEKPNLQDLGSRDVPAYARIRNAFRFLLDDPGKKTRGLVFLVEDVLFGLLGIEREEILSMLDFPKKGMYDLVMASEVDYNRVWRKLVSVKDDPILEGVEVIPHFPRRERLITVRMYSPYIPEEEIAYFLSRFCDDVIPNGKVMNQYGIWVTKWKYMAKLRENPDGTLLLPPARFKIGAVNGDLFLSGMDEFCRSCKRYGHSKEQCTYLTCTKCGQEGHSFQSCPLERNCNLCGKSGHMYFSCPERKRNKSGEATESKTKTIESGKEKKKETKTDGNKKVSEIPVVQQKRETQTQKKEEEIVKKKIESSGPVVKRQLRVESEKSESRGESSESCSESKVVKYPPLVGEDTMPEDLVKKIKKLRSIYTDAQLQKGRDRNYDLYDDDPDKFERTYKPNEWVLNALDRFHQYTEEQKKVICDGLLIAKKDVGITW